MNLIRKAMIGAVLAFTLVASLAPRVEADGRHRHHRHEQMYAMAKITNNTESTISYQVKWGDGDWVDYTLQPGAALNHYWTSDRAPALSIQFDRGNNTGTISYTLPLWAVGEGSDGKPYQFLVSGGYFDLRTA